MGNNMVREKLYQFTKVQGAVTTYTFVQEKQLSNSEETYGLYSSNYGQYYHITQFQLTKYHISLESCYEAWIESIEKFKEKVIKQFENKCGIDYLEYNKATKFLENYFGKEHLKKIKDEMDTSK